MTKLSAIIVDDENLARRGLSLRLQNIPDVEVIAECSNGAEALRAIAEHGPDMVFLDIQMPGMDGFEVINHLQADTMPMIVFVTAFNEYAVEAFKVHDLWRLDQTRAVFTNRLGRITVGWMTHPP